MSKELKNISLSVHQRLLHKARQSSRTFNELLQHYAIERFLYRISKSLRRTLARYFRYYHNFRTHLSLEKDATTPRAIQDANLGPVIEVSEVGGLHHHYKRQAA